MPTCRSLAAMALVPILFPSLARADPAAPPRLVLATDPIGAMYGAYALSASYAIHPRVALRADAGLTEGFDGYGPGGWHVAASVPIYFDRAFHGPFIEPGMVARQIPVNVFATGVVGPIGYAAPEHTFGPELLVGWQWTFDSGLTLTAAIGASRIWSRSETPGLLGMPIALPESYLRVGYAF